MNRAALHDHFTTGGYNTAQYAIHQRRLTGTRWPEENDVLSLVYLEVNILQSKELIGLALVIGHLEVSGFYDRFRHTN